MSPLKIKENPEAVIVLLCSQVDAVVSYLRAHNINNEILMYPYFGKHFPVDEFSVKRMEYGSEWITDNENKIRKLYNLKDEYTKQILEECILQRKEKEIEFIDYKKMIPYEGICQYFYDDDIAPVGDITLIDCGAYTGDSIELIYKKFGTKLKRVYAFEPDIINCEEMDKRLRGLEIRDKCELLMMGTYDQEKEIYFDDSGIDGRIIEGDNIGNNNKIHVTKLDNITINVIGNLAIKMDIEGSELKALQGAEKLIKEYTPYMAICLYHKMEDILEIPEYINKINPNYIFYLRAGIHLECYAVPKTRVTK